MALYFPAAFLTGGVVSLTGSNVKAVLQNSTRASGRGVSFSIFNLTNDLGSGLGPFVASLFIASFGRQTAFNVAACFWFPCGLINAAVAMTLTRDMERLAAVISSDQRTNTIASASPSVDQDENHLRCRQHETYPFHAVGTKRPSSPSEVEMTTTHTHAPTRQVSADGVPVDKSVGLSAADEPSQGRGVQERALVPLV